MPTSDFGTAVSNYLSTPHLPTSPHFLRSHLLFSAAEALNRRRIAAAAPSPPSAMRKAILMAFALITTLAMAAATPPVRRSRFLADKFLPPPSYYDCIKKPPSVCLEPGSPGATCCKGMCVDTEYNNQHCGNCNKTCKHGDTCCAGHCVNLLTDRKNCGVCGIRCSSHDCTFGFCNYAG